jgi:hypothetical protein
LDEDHNFQEKDNRGLSDWLETAKLAEVQDSNRKSKHDQDRLNKKLRQNLEVHQDLYHFLKNIAI